MQDAAINTSAVVPYGVTKKGHKEENLPSQCVYSITCTAKLA
jgi:hypothetical protein